MSKYGKVIWMDGNFVKPEDAVVNVMSHVIHYGSGLFEGIMAYNTPDGVSIFRLDEHIDRLFYSAKMYYYKIPYTKAEIKQAIIDTVKTNGFKGCYIRPSIFMGEGWNAIDITDDVKVHVTISSWELNNFLKKDVELCISSIRRFSAQMVPMQAKAASNYMNSYLIRNEAHDRGYSDGIALDSNGYISETSSANIFMVRDNVVYTPSLACSVLNGLTRKSVITLLKDMGTEVNEVFITRDEIHQASEIFICGTASEIKAVKSIDGIQIGDGNYPLVEMLIKEYNSITRGNSEKYKGWLTNVK